jgi:hypothetical protein
MNKLTWTNMLNINNKIQVNIFLFLSFIFRNEIKKSERSKLNKSLQKQFTIAIKIRLSISS